MGRRRANARTRERILDGALRAIARHGLTKLGMSDVSDSAGVSRGTLYRYFPSREELLHEPGGVRERERFQQRVGEALRGAPPGATRLRGGAAARRPLRREHPAIRRLIETEPAFVLRLSARAVSGAACRHRRVPRAAAGRTEPVRDGRGDGRAAGRLADADDDLRGALSRPRSRRHGARPDRGLPPAQPARRAGARGGGAASAAPHRRKERRLTTSMATTNKLFGGTMMSPIVDPYPVYKRLRDEQPAIPVNTMMGVNHMITRYDDVLTIPQGRQALYSSRGQRARHRHRHGAHDPRDGGQGARPPSQHHHARSSARAR